MVGTFDASWEAGNPEDAAERKEGGREEVLCVPQKQSLLPTSITIMTQRPHL